MSTPTNQAPAINAELLAALEGLFEHCTMVHKHWGEGCNQREADAAQNTARAAIATATKHALAPARQCRVTGGITGHGARFDHYTRRHQMDTSKTVFSKGRDGWQGTDEIDMQQSVIDYQGRTLARRLTISTWKSSRGGIHTVANCALHGGGFTTTDVFGDFRKTVAKLDNRCTEKAVRQLHAAVMEQQADALLIEARAYYEAKDAAKALHAKRDAELRAQDQQQAA